MTTRLKKADCRKQKEGGGRQQAAITFRWPTVGCILLSAFCFLAPSFGQNTPIVLKAARMFDGHRMSTPGLVVVSGTTILGVGADAPMPSGAKVMDFGDATLSPGLMDAHTHLAYPSVGDFRQFILDGLQKTIAERT